MFLESVGKFAHKRHSTDMLGTYGHAEDWLWANAVYRTLFVMSFCDFMCSW